MALAIKSSFENLKTNLEITTLQKTTVSTRQTNVREAVETEMEVLRSFLTGSYMRSTMIAPLKEADIDIFMVMSPDYYEADGQANLLDRVRRVLLKTYPTTPKISRNGQAVTITFTDFKVDVVPSFNRQGGGYLIPDSVKKVWIETDPDTHTTSLSSANAYHNSVLVPIIKMIKAWNRNIGHGFLSFYLELLAIKTFTGVQISDFPSGMRFFFDKGRELIKYKLKDPAECGGYVNPFDNITTVEDAVSRFETAFNRAKKAEQYDRDGKTEDAVNEWRKIFGDCFPAYG